MSIFDEIRRAAPWAKDFSDEEIIDAGSQLTGLGVRDVAKGLGININDKRNPLSAGLSSGTDDLQGLMYSGGAAAADALGLTGVRDWANKRARINEVESQLNGRPDLDNIEDQSWSSAPAYVTYQLAKQAPNIVGGIAAGAVVPELVVPAALSRGAAFLPRALGGGGMGARLAEAGGEFAAKRAAYDAAINTGSTFARQLTGGAAFNYGQGVGSLYQEAAAAGDPDAGIKSLTGGLPYAVTETLPEAMLVGRFTGGSGFGGNFLQRAGKSALVQAPAGATSELLQNEMEMGYGPELSQAQIDSRRLNSAAAGGLVEGLLGGFGGMFQRRLRPGSDLLTGDNPTENSININNGAGLNTQDWINQLTGVNRPRSVNTPDSFKAAMAEPTGQFGIDPTTGQERPLTGADTLPNAQPAQTGNTQLDAVMQHIVPKYGAITPIMGTSGPVGFNFMGKDYATEEQAQKAAIKLFDKESKKSEIALGAEQALVDANREILADKDGNPGPHLTASQVNTYGNQIGLGTATSLENVVERLDRRIAELGKAKGNNAVATRELFSVWRSKLTGEPVSQNVQTNPAVQNTKQGPNATEPQQVAPQAPKTNATQVTPATEDVNSLIQSGNEQKSFVAMLAANGVELAPKQMEVVQYIEDKLRNNQADEVIDSEGVFKFAEIAKALGVKRGSVAVPIEAIRNNIIKASGRSLEEIKAGLQKRAAENRKVQAADETNLGLSPDKQNALLDEAEVFGENSSMQDINSIGGSVSDVGKSEELPESAKVQSELDIQIEQKKAELAEVEANKAIEKILASPKAKLAIADFEAIFDKPISILTRAEAAEFVETYNNLSEEFENFADVEAELIKEFSEYVQVAENNGSKGLQDNSGVSQQPVGQRLIGSGSEATSATGQAGERQTSAGTEIKPAVSAAPVVSKRKGRVAKNPDSIWEELRAQYPQLPPLNELHPEAQADWLMAKKHDLATANNVFESSKKYSAGEEPQFGKSQGKDNAPTKPYTAAQLIEELKSFLRVDTLGRRIQVVDTPEQLNDLKDVVIGIAEERAFGWTRDGKAILIASRIQQGQGRAKFMHEVGAHLGLEGLLSTNMHNDLTAQITKWADANDGSMESNLARRAIERVGAANTADEDIHAEMLAYFIEEAMQAGIDPTATKADTALGRWFRTLWAAFKVAIRKLGIKPESITAQDIVDLAFGAAKLEVSGTWHGTAAEFRKFDHKYMGSGEGAQAFGWGTYLAQKFGIAKEYWKDDVKRKDAMPVYNGKPMSAFDPEMQLTLENLETAYKNGWYVHSAIEEMQGELTILSTDKNQSESDRARYKLLLDKLNSIDESKLDFLVHQQELAKHYGEELTQPVVHPETMETIFEPGLLIGPITAPKLAREMASAGIDEAEINGNIVQFKERKSVRPDGAMLRLDTAVSEDEMYDWDKEIQQQSPEVKKALDEIKALIPQDVLDDIEYERNANWDELTGLQLVGDGYKNVGVLDQLLADGVITGGPKAKEAADAGKTHKAVSMLLEEHGIPGIKFYDRPSRANAATGKKNPERIQFTIDGAKRLIQTLEDAIVKATSQAEIRSLTQSLKDQHAVLDKAKQDLQEAKAYTPTRNYVIFDPKNIIRVASQTAADRERVRFGKNPTAAVVSQRQGKVERKIAKLPEPVRGPVQKIFDNIFNAAKKGVYAFAFTKDLADIAAKVLPSSVNYIRLMELKSAAGRAHENLVDNIIRDYEALDANERGIGAGSVNRFIHDSTRSGKWGYKIKQDASIKLDPEFKARFEKFSPEAQAVIKAVFKHGYDTLQRKKQLVRDEINSEFDGILSDIQDVQERREVEAQRRAKLKQFDTLMAIEANKPYAPLKRFGNYVVVGKSKEYIAAEKNEDVAAIRKMQSNEKHYYVQFAETIGEAKSIRDEIAGDYAYADAFEKNAAREAIYGGQEMFAAFQKLKSLVIDQFGSNEDDNKSLKAVNRMVSDLYLSTLSESSARKSENRRMKVAGADLDMMRAFATQGRADAHFIGALLHSPEINKSLQAMMKEAKSNDPGRADRARLANEFLMRHAVSMDYKSTRTQDAVQRMTSLYMLAFSPSYYLQNLTQTPMMSLPVIAGRHTYAASWAALTDAYAQLGPMLKGSGVARRMMFDKAPAPVKKLIDTLVARGVLDIGMDQDLGSFRSGGEGALSLANNKLDRFLRGLPQKVEAINRVSTAIAAYNLEMARLKKEGKMTQNRMEEMATDYAEKIINTTHGDYSGFNSPRFISATPWGKVLFQFRKFQIIQLSLMARLVNDSLQGEERWAARKALAFMLGHTAVVGGAMGLPGFAAVAFLLGMFGDDEPDNPELTIRKMIGDKDIADLILKGAPSLIGVDLSGKLGMGQMLSILPFSDIDLSSRSGYEKTATAMLGPFFGGVMPRMVDSMDYMSKGDYYKGVETALPIGLGNVLKAARVATEGMTNKQGDLVMSADEFNFAQTIAMAMGIPLTETSHKNFLQKVQIQYDDFFREKTSDLKHRYTKAIRGKESTGELVREWNELQKVRSQVGYTRQSLGDLLKSPAEQAKRERGVVGGVETSKSNRAFLQQVSKL